MTNPTQAGEAVKDREFAIKYCPDGRSHDWRTDYAIRSEYEPSMESGQQTCPRCGMQRFFSREANQ